MIDRQKRRIINEDFTNQPPTLLRIRDVYPGSKRFRIPDPDPHNRTGVFSTQKIVSKLSEI
jgi:hypothetical protein